MHEKVQLGQCFVCVCVCYYKHVKQECRSTSWEHWQALAAMA